MPVADPFIFKGLGNGLNYCLTKLDVSEFHRTAPLTLAEAFKIYYNLYQLNAAASVVTGAIDISVGDVALETEPKERRCDGGDAAFDFAADPISAFYACKTELSADFNIVRMYNGDVEDEANFIGYGIDGDTIDGYGVFARSYAGTDGGGGYVGTHRILTSYARYDPADASQEATDWYGQYSILATSFLSTSNITVSDIPFVEMFWDNLGAGQSAEITSLEFYTYP